ncbi:MAG: small acid-soluble spore protein Tlp [Syntrophomonadaceae bacterium]|nr:small acid-soluble spore protein Tlp [Syntrophomonadaceae bacterium]
MKHNPDDRRDNVDKLQFMINHTIENMEKAEETMELTDDPRQKKAIKEKNIRRREALRGFSHEIKDEAEAKQDGYE